MAIQMKKETPKCDWLTAHKNVFFPPPPYSCLVVISRGIVLLTCAATVVQHLKCCSVNTGQDHNMSSVGHFLLLTAFLVTFTDWCALHSILADWLIVSVTNKTCASRNTGHVLDKKKIEIFFKWQSVWSARGKTAVTLLSAVSQVMLSWLTWLINPTLHIHSGLSTLH